MFLAICIASASDPALVTRLQMTDRMHSRSERTWGRAQFKNRQAFTWKESRDAFVRDARGVEEQVGGGEHEGGHLRPSGGEDVLLRLEAEAADLRLDDLGARVGPGELRGEADHRQRRLLLRRVHDRRHLVVAGAVAAAPPPPERERWVGDCAGGGDGRKTLKLDSMRLNTTQRPEPTSQWCNIEAEAVGSGTDGHQCLRFIFQVCLDGSNLCFKFCTNTCKEGEMIW
jgi:hypothetical protein